MGKRGDNGMKNDFAKHVTNRVKPLLEGVDTNNVQNRMRTLKGNYQLARQAQSQSGFSFTEDGRVIANEAVWVPYIEAHPKAKVLRTIRIPHYDKLAMIFGNDTANGEMCMEGNDEDVTRNTETIDLCNENPGNDDEGNVFVDLESSHGPSPSVSHTKPPGLGKRRRSLMGLDQFDDSCDKIAAMATDIASALKTVNRLPDVMIALKKIPKLTNEERMVALDIMGRILHLQMARRYAIFVGKVPGIYERWSNCHAQVHGYGGACYNRFDSLGEAEEAFANYNASQQPHGNLPPSAPLQPQPAPLHQQPTAPPAPPMTLHPHPTAPPGTLNPQPIVPNAQGLCGHYAIHEGNHSPFERYF